MHNSELRLPVPSITPYNTDPTGQGIIEVVATGTFILHVFWVGAPVGMGGAPGTQLVIAGIAADDPVSPEGHGGCPLVIMTG